MAKRSPTDRVVPSLVEARAIQAWRRGEATPEQQKIAFDFVLLKACGATKDSFIPGQADSTAYLAGRRSVALQVSWVCSQPAENFRKQGETD